MEIDRTYESHGAPLSGWQTNQTKARHQLWLDLDAQGLIPEGLSRDALWLILDRTGPGHVGEGVRHG